MKSDKKGGHVADNTPLSPSIASGGAVYNLIKSHSDYILEWSEMIDGENEWRGWSIHAFDHLSSGRATAE